MKSALKHLSHSSVVQPREVTERERATLEFREFEGIAETSYTVARVGLSLDVVFKLKLGNGEQIKN